MKTVLASVLLALVSNACAARLPMQKRASSSGVHITSKAAAAGASQGSSADISIKDFQDTGYFVGITLGDQDFTVQLDTGSSDLWVFPNQTALTLTNTTDIPSVLIYGIGNATGTIDFAEVKIGPYTIPSQAFINVNVTHDLDSTFATGASGIMGMSFTDADSSTITFGIQSTFGNGTGLDRAPITNIFAQNPSAPNCFDILLERVSDLEAEAGTFLIGEHLDGYEDVAIQPRLFKQWPDRWTVALDSMAVNGNPFNFGPSSVPNIPAGKVAAVLDTGFSFPPLPPAAVDAIYSTIPGAVNVSDFGGTDAQWLVPCTGVTNLTFTLGGIEYPIHPLDLTSVNAVELPAGPNGTLVNTTICINTYQYTILVGPGFTGQDLVLGDAFIRNVYASFNMGDANGTSNNSFVQLLPTTNLDDAITDFAVSRASALASMPPTIDPSILAPILRAASEPDNSSPSGAQAPPTPSSTAGAAGGAGALASDDGSSSSSSDDHLTSLVEKYGPVIIGLLAGNVVIGILLFAIGLVMCLRGVVKSGVTTRNVGRSYAPVRVKEIDTMAVPESEGVLAGEYNSRYQDD